MALFAMLLWGSAIPMIKTTYKVFDISKTDPGAMTLVAGYRFVIAGFIVILYKFLFDEEKSKPINFKPTLYIGTALLQITIQYIFYYNGLSQITGVHSSIIQSTNFLMVLIFAHFMMPDDKFNLKKLICVILGLIATILCNYGSRLEGGESSLKGEIFIIISTALNAIGTVVIRKWAGDENTYDISIFQFIFGGGILIILGLFTANKIFTMNLKGLILLIYGGFISSTAFVIWYLLLKYRKASRVGVYKLFIPIFGSLLSVIILKDRFNPYLVEALILTSSATLFLNSNIMERKKN